ncbi:permease family-domain-containing protein [Aspergillus pseudodeflectus]|uniref:Permease family-domain-containing protein n=1 Tax=Aspergillus pseudodeflectus TaxID=176178 RepID=A0ABR4JQE4_9EURO
MDNSIHSTDGPDSVVPGSNPKKTIAQRMRSVVRAFTTRDGLIGDYDYGHLFRPELPFMTKDPRPPPFFGLNEKIPVLLAFILGLQHALAMLAGVVTPPLILSSSLSLSPDLQQYLVSTALIVCGLLSMVQITRFHIYKTPYYIGSGVLSVMGVSFAIISVASGAFTQMYSNGFCQVDADGNRLPCPEAYGALIGTSACCALVEIVLAFVPPKIMQKIFPPIVTGPTVMLIGINLIGTGFKDWAGGSGCMDAICPNEAAPRPLPWGSPEFIGLGFLVFVTIILCERFGAPIMKSCSVVVGLLMGCIVAAACGYFSRANIDAAPVASFIWVKTFPLSVYGPMVLPIIAVFIICACECIGDVTATCDVSRLEVRGGTFESRLQGAVLADGINSVIAALATMTPMTTFAQNNGVIALTRCANRTAGYCCCIILIVAGIFAKFAAAIVAIPNPVMGGMKTFLFASVVISGQAIVSKAPFNRRNRFILTASMALGYGATLVPMWFANVFPPTENRDLEGFENAIELVLETGFAVTAFVAMLLNGIMPAEVEEIGAVTAVPAPSPSDRNGEPDYQSKQA